MAAFTHNYQSNPCILFAGCHLTPKHLRYFQIHFFKKNLPELREFNLRECILVVNAWFPGYGSSLVKSWM